jgi:uncharacterized protein YbjT (DUF2867 family)
VKITVIGGSGLIGSKVVSRLRRKGHEVVAASLRSSVDTVTGKGLAEAVDAARVVVDLANSPSFEEQAAIDFFEKSSRNLLAAEAAAGTSHHVALSVVGTERLRETGYFRAKAVQEELIEASGIPYTIVRSTQFFEFMAAIAQSGTVGQTAHLSPALFQPVAADDVADAVSDAALGAPVNGTIEIAGPDRTPIDELVDRFLRAMGDSRRVIADAKAGYFGIAVNDKSLTPGDGARIGATRFDDWLSAAASRR